MIGIAIATAVPNVNSRITIAATIPTTSLEWVAGLRDLLAEIAARRDVDPRPLGRAPRPRSRSSARSVGQRVGTRPAASARCSRSARPSISASLPLARQRADGLLDARAPAVGGDASSSTAFLYRPSVSLPLVDLEDERVGPVRLLGQVAVEQVGGLGRARCPAGSGRPRSGPRRWRRGRSARPAAPSRGRRRRAGGACRDG